MTHEQSTDLTLARLDAALAELKDARDELAQRLADRDRRWAEDDAPSEDEHDA